MERPHVVRSNGAKIEGTHVKAVISTKFLGMVLNYMGSVPKLVDQFPNFS